MRRVAADQDRAPRPGQPEDELVGAACHDDPVPVDEVMGCDALD
ncbi:MAG: hypothetical protein ABWY11_05150 [Umezawaea sp.]